MSWRPLSELETHQQRPVAAVFTDLDDTLTTAGRLPARAYRAVERLGEAGVPVLVVTGRPAGWCDLIARLWPVAGVVGENGALAYRYDPAARRMQRIYALDPEQRAASAAGRAALERAVLAAVPGARVAADQPFRQFDLAIDFAEDVEPLDAAAVEAIRRAFVEHGAQAKVSSIHVNGWFGDFDKMTMIRRCCAAWFGWSSGLDPSALYAGDSPNDEPAFAAFPRSVGVANVRDFADRIRHGPSFVTEAPGGAGFAELVDHLLS